MLGDINKYYIILILDYIIYYININKYIWQAECIGRRTDPYEFDATGEENGTNVDGLRRQRDDPSKPGSLFTSEGLQPSYKDLDQIFDNSDADTSSDETVSLHLLASS